jgi:hypothetical protein
MRHAVPLSLAAILCASAAGGLAAAAPKPAAPAPTAQAYKAPRNSLGQPDLTGNWSNAFLTPLIRTKVYGTTATYTEEEVETFEGVAHKNAVDGDKPVDNTKPLTDGVIRAHGGLNTNGNEDRAFLDPGGRILRVHGQPRNSVLTTPDGQIPPRIAGAPPAPERELPPVFDKSNGMFDNPEQLGTGERCIVGLGRSAGPPMYPNGIYNQNYHIVQTKDVVAIEVEMIHDVRIVRLNGTHRTDGVRPYLGDSIGHYEGDTLVVETTNMPELQNLYGSWKNLKITERFTRDAKDRILYQFTIDDPTIWAKPWGGEYEFAALDGRLYEYACAEGNHGLEGILAGARQQDAAEEAAKQRASK